MVEVIPSINALTFPEVQEKIRKVEPYVSWCHLDVTDGVFSIHPTWNNPADLADLKTKLQAEVHLMVMNPEAVAEEWLRPPIQRVIVHLEATRDPEAIIRQCRLAHTEIGFAIRPDTSWEALKPWLGKLDLVQVLAVNPGPAGQKVGADTHLKIFSLRAACPECRIETDGGMDPDTASRAARAGADIIVSASFIFKDDSVEENISALRRV